MSDPDSTPLLQVRGLSKRFGPLVVLSQIDLTVPRGSVVILLGKSGSGKSVLLKCLAGVLKPDGGEIMFDGQLLGERDSDERAAFRRRCSYLFQSNALLDSLTAWDNVALPLEQTTLIPKSEIARRVREALRRLELEDAARRYPGQLSGGMQKRLALARALVTQPELVLFDEPTAGLDPVRRNAVFEMIAHYQRELGFTAVVVTHDLPEALVTGDRVALVHGGKIHFEGTPHEFNHTDDYVVRTFRDTTEQLHDRIVAIRRGEICPLTDLS